MRSNGLIAGINWAIAATAVAGTVFVMSQIFAPIPPTTWSVGAQGNKVQPKSANGILQYNRGEMGNSIIPQESTSIKVVGQQRMSPTVQQPLRNETAGQNFAAGFSNNTTNQNQSNPQRSQPTERYGIAPSSPTPAPSAGAENLPDYMRYF